MKLSYKLYILSKVIVAQAKFSGIIVTYPANFVKNKKFRSAITKAINLGYLGEQCGGKGDHHNYSHVEWLGEQKTFSYDEGSVKGRKGEVDRSYVDHLVMLCTKVKTILDKAKQTNTTLPLKNSEGKNMNLEQYENHFGITKQIAQQNVNYVATELLGK